MAHTNEAAIVTTQDQRDLARTLDVEIPSDTTVTWSDLAGKVEVESDSAFHSIGQAVRSDLVDSLDRELLERERAALERQIDRLPEVRDAGIPDEPEDLYVEVAAPGWRNYNHLVDVGFFESLDANQPRFTPDHIERTTRELALAEPLSTSLDEIGFDEREKTALLVEVANNNERLSRWVPTNQIPDSVEFDTSNVPPLYQRAAGGALLWIRDLDRHLWQKRVLITDDILDAAVGHVKAMLGGLHVLTSAAIDIAGEDRELTDGQLTAALTASAAILIVSQEEILHDAFYITDDMRASSELR
jgi:hypothetical protein